MLGMTAEEIVKRYIRYVSFEMSNICNFSSVHKKCPLSCQKEKIILPYSIVVKTMASLKENGFKGEIGFHCYNEPTSDPRLYLLLKEAREIFQTDVKLFILSNGYFVNQEFLNEIWDLFAVERVTISAYSDHDLERVSKYKAPGKMSYDILKAALDNRMDFYTRDVVDCNKPCLAPLHNLIIKCTGDIGLCCLDFKNSYPLGSLRCESLEEILVSEKLQIVRENLEKGNRTFELCKRCGWTR